MADVLYKNQSWITISLDTEVDISAATTAKILWENPNGTKGEWTAGTAVNSETGVESLVQYTGAGGEFKVVGKWKLQAYVEVGGLKGYGQVITETIDDNLE